MSRRWIIPLILWLTSCATVGPEFSGESGEAPYIVWPDSPEPPRIEYVSQFRGAEDLGLRETFSSRMRELLAGGDARRMSRPYSVTANSNLIIVADPGLSVVHVFDKKRKIYQIIKDFGGHQIASPIGVALDGDRLFIADSELNKVFILDLGFKLLSTLEDFVRPTSLAYDSSRQRLYVADTLSHEVQVFGKSGEFLFRIGERGNQDGQFNYPSHLSFSGDRLFVNDTMNFRVQIFNADGEHLKTFGKHGTGSGYFVQPKGVAVDSDGHVYVADALAHRIQIFDQDGNLLLGFGEVGDGPGNFRIPTGLAIWDDQIYVADSYNQRIQIFRYLREDH